MCNILYLLLLVKSLAYSTSQDIIAVIIETQRTYVQIRLPEEGNCEGKHSKNVFGNIFFTPFM